MSLGQALNTAAAGLRANQTGISIVAGNVSNAQTAGYTRKTVTTEAISAGLDLVSVKVASINRTLDTYVQKQLRTETSGASYASLRSQIYSRLQDIYGDPNSTTALETVFNNFTTAAQALSSSPSDTSARKTALTTAQAMAQQLNSTTEDIQALRENCEQGLADTVRSANEALQGLAKVNVQLAASPNADASRMALLDQRDSYLDKLSTLMDIRVNETNDGEVAVFTGSGRQMVSSGQAWTMSFDTQGMMSPNARWDADPNKRQVGTITLTNSNGSSVDLIADQAFRSGQIAAYLDMRDNVLVQAQDQIDQFAVGLAQAMSDTTTAGAPVTVGTQSGFDVDTASLLAGNRVDVAYTDSSGTKQTVTFVRVNTPPLPAVTTSGPNNRTVPIDWSGGLASAITQMNTALGGQAVVSNPSGTTLRILNNVAGTSQVTAASTTTTASSLVGQAALPLFTDGDTLYTGKIGGDGTQSIGLAGRIKVNDNVVADPSRLVVYQDTPKTADADQTRPNFIYNQLTKATRTYPASTGIGTSASPYSGDLTSFLRQAMSQQGEAASNASSLSEGQAMVVSALQQRFDDSAAVNVDQEMTNLLTLQTAYGANARVFSTVNEMLKTLLQMMG